MFDDLLGEYDRVLPLLEARGRWLKAELGAWLEAQPGIKIHSVEMRLKSRQSLASKLARPDRNYADLWFYSNPVFVKVQ